MMVVVQQLLTAAVNDVYFVVGAAPGCVGVDWMIPFGRRRREDVYRGVEKSGTYDEKKCADEWGRISLLHNI